MRPLLIAATVALVTTVTAVPAHAYTTEGLYLYMDARVADSYNSSNPGEWNDISVNGRNGTINGSVTYDNTNDALFFDGTDFGQNYVGLSGAFDDWGNGFTVEFTGEFGANVNNWERIFDFGNGPESDNVWVGRLDDTQNLAIEIWDGSTNLGRCHTTDGQLAGRTMHHWIITMDTTPTCRIYMDGTEVATQLRNAGVSEIGSPSTSGTAYPGLPNTITRIHNYVGASNWTDPDFEGTIQMIRIYTRALSQADVTENESMSASSGSGGSNGSGGTGGSGSRTHELAATGFDVTPWLIGVVALIVSGVVLRRRSA
ncbi:MAG: hypothetical protein RLZ72_626 [Actinomycetota bacterium]|jgi:hypothetical protein